MKKKSFKLNFVDIAIVVLLVLVIAVAGYVVVDKTIVGSSKGDAFSYEILFREIPEEVLNSVEKNAVIFEGGKNTEIGEITDFSFTESTKYEFNTLTGEYVNVEVPDRYDLTVSVSAEGRHDDISYFIEEYEIYIGKAVDVKSLGFVAHGYVVAVDER